MSYEVQTTPPPPPEGLEAEWGEWIYKRTTKGKKHVPTPFALSQAIKKLDAFSKNSFGVPEVEVKRYLIVKAIENGWDGLFPMKDWDWDTLRAMQPKKQNQNTFRYPDPAL